MFAWQPFCNVSGQCTQSAQTNITLALMAASLSPCSYRLTTIVTASISLSDSSSLTDISSNLMRTYEPVCLNYTAVSLYLSITIDGTGDLQTLPDRLHRIWASWGSNNTISPVSLALAGYRDSRNSGPAPVPSRRCLNTCKTVFKREGDIANLQQWDFFENAGIFWIFL